MKAVAAVLKEPNTPFVLEELDVAQPRPDEILVRIQAVGICHTDLVFASGAMGTNFPLVLGHEGAGEVVAIGEKITKVAPGDKVLLTFDSCGHCANCEAEAPAYCDSFTGLNFACARPDGTSPLSKDGQAVSGVFFGQSSFASLAVAHERNVVKAPSDADLSLLAPPGLRRSDRGSGRCCVRWRRARAAPWSSWAAGRWVSARCWAAFWPGATPSS